MSGAAGRSSRILVNTVSLTAPLTGIGRYSLEICRRLQNDKNLDLTFFYGYFSKHLADGKTRDPLFNAMTGSRKKLASFPVLKKVGRYGLLILSSLDNSSQDLYWEPNIVPLPQLAKKAERTITTVHDFSWYHHPEWHPLERLDFFNRHFSKGIESSDHLITGSEYTRNEIMEILGVPREKITVIHHGVDHEVFKKYPRQQCSEFAIKSGLPEKFILFVGTLEPRKNLERLLAAYSILPEKIQCEFKLVIAGGKGWNDDQLRRMLSGMGKNVHLKGYVSDSELPLLYNLASVFVYPSLYEGFGIPPIEAMACGCPVVVSNTTAMPEICGDAALYCNPQDPEDISHNIQKSLEDSSLADTLKDRGFKKTKKYSWDISAENHSNIFKKAGKEF